jgi:hypothetical protein
VSAPADVLEQQFAHLDSSASSPQAPVDEFAHLTGAPLAAPSASATDWVKAAGSAFVRPIVKAATGLPLMAMDAGVAARNLLSGNLDAMGRPKPGAYSLPSQGFNQALDQYTQPPSGVGKAGEFINTVLAGALGPMPSTASSSVPATATTNLTAAQQLALQNAKPLGMRVTPGQGMGSQALQQLEAKFESQPWSSGPFNAIKAGNQAALDRQAAISIGENAAPNVDSTVMGRAADRMGDVFESARSPSRIVMADPKATTGTIDQIESQLQGLLPNGVTLRGNSLVQQLENLTQSGSVNGQQLGQLSSKLGKAAYKQMSSPGGDRDLGDGLYQVKDHVDDLLQSAMSPEDAQAYSAVRGQYRNLMNLAKPGVVNSSTGHVSGTNYANLLQRTDRQGYLFGGNQSDLYNALRFSQAFKPAIGDSGTATRSPGLLSSLVPTLGMLAGGAGGHASGLGALEGGGAGALAAPVLANMASRAYLRSAPAIRAARQAPSLMRPALQPLTYGGLIGLMSSQQPSATPTGLMGQ